MSLNLGIDRRLRQVPRTVESLFRASEEFVEETRRHVGPYTGPDGIRVGPGQEIQHPKALPVAAHRADDFAQSRRLCQVTEPRNTGQQKVIARQKHDLLGDTLGTAEALANCRNPLGADFLVSRTLAR